MANMDQVMNALRKADQAGNVEDAKRLAQIARQMRDTGDTGAEGGNRFPVMSQVNRGIADAAGGLVDFLNPFDRPHALNPFPGGTGSARQGLSDAMQAGGIEVAQSEPQGIVEGMARGAGQAAGSMIPATAGLQVLSRAGGTVGQLADDAFRSLASISGATAEMAAGATSEGARQAVDAAGGPEWVQDTAAIAAGGLALPAATAAPRYMPSVVGGKRAISAVKRAVAPYTEAGGREVARRRMQGLAGGPERAQELARRVETDNEFGLTPAQQTQDPNMMGVERLAAEQDAALAARLAARQQSTMHEGRQAVRGMGGDEEDAQSFFRQRRDDFKARLQQQVRDATEAADAGLSAQQPRRTEAENSSRARQQVDRALERAVMQERDLWEAVPRGATVGTSNTKAAVQRISDALPYAQRGDLPKAAAETLTAENVYSDQASVNDLHGLYSELRRVARSAMAGNDQNKNAARIANEIADAILLDLGTADAASEVGRAINEARAFSAALHETFDRGAVGKVLKRTIDGDSTIDPELTLPRTVGRGGTEGAVAARQIETATEGGATPFIQDYLKERFSNAARSATGEFTNGAAQRFMRDNKALLERYPELRDELSNAVRAREGADQLSARITRRLAQLEGKKAAGGAVVDGKTVQGVLNAQNPAQAARRLANEARKDPAGKALAGLKASFADELIRGASSVKAGRETFSGDKLLRQLADPKTKAALRQIFSAPEIGRLQRIARDMAKAQDNQAADVGPSLSGEKPSRVLEYLARVVAARHGAQMGGGGGGSLQTAQMASSRTKEILGKLVSDKASDIMARAVEDPDLFKALMTDGASPRLDERVLPRLAPYLIGTLASEGSSQ